MCCKEFWLNHKSTNMQRCCGNKICCTLKCGIIWQTVFETLIAILAITQICFIYLIKYNPAPTIGGAYITWIFIALGCTLTRMVILYLMCCKDSSKVRGAAAQIVG